jgi:serine/threonine protein kinase/energy-coupling factor transporter ATP-binding protein EcfA2
MTTEQGFAELHQVLIDLYDLEEFRILCANLEVNFDDLRGEGRSGKARELVLYLQRCGRLDELEASVQERRQTRDNVKLTQALDNPYFHWGPIRDQEYFYGREEETRQVLQAVNHGQCVSLVGPRKIGKTSLLLHLEALNHDGSSREEVYVYVDGQAHRETQASVFYSEILHRIGEVLIAQDRPVQPVEEPKDEMDLMGLRQAISSLTRRGIRPVILIDEFDALCENQNFDLAFFSGLRSLATTLGVVYVTASKRTLFQLNREKKILGSPFFNYFQPLYVGLFDDESVLRLIREPSAACGAHFDDKMVAEISRLAGKHPFFSQRVCHIAFEMLRVQKGESREQDLEQIRVRSRQELEDQMASYWEDLGPEERRILFSVATGEALQQVSEVTLENLVRQCLLVKSNGDYYIFSALFKDYVCGQSRPKLPREQKWLDRFQDWQELGRGAMSIVYKAYQPALNRYVAIKELVSQADLLDEDTERFRREARSIAKLDHPNILPVYDFYPEVDRAYIVMKYAAAGSLADQLNEAKLPFDLAKAVEIVIDIGRALGYAHRQEIIHRDIKPANIFMGEDDWPLLGDFGLALTRGKTSTEEAGLTGSTDYVPPEQILDAGKADRRSDIYSLGVVLYHLLVGKVPYAEEAHAGDRLVKRLTQGVPAPRSRNPRISMKVEQIVLRATASSPGDRYQTAEDLVEDLEAALLDGDTALSIRAIKDNPYVYGDPIRVKKAFIGREDELEQIIRAVTKLPKQDVFIVGERRSGKTSLLYRVQERLNRPFVPVYVVLNMSEPRTESVLEFILHRIVHSLVEQEILDKDEWEKHRLSHVHFVDNVREIIIAAKAILVNVRIVLLIDEAEYLLKVEPYPSGIWGAFSRFADSLRGRHIVDERLHNVLRAALQSREIGNDLCAVVAGTTDLSTYFSQQSSPFFNHFRFVPLKPLTIEETLELIVRPASSSGCFYSQGAIQRITALSGRHPYYCQALCYEAFDHALQAGRMVIGDTDVSIVENKVVADLFEGFRSSYWYRANQTEKQFLRALAHAKPTGAVTRAQVKRLLDWQIINEDQGSYSFSGGLFKEWTRMVTER